MSYNWKNIFATNGEDIVRKKDAKINQTETTEFDLIVVWHMKLSTDNYHTYQFIKHKNAPMRLLGAFLEI